MKDLTQLQDYLLYQIGQYIHTPDIINLAGCSKFFLEHFDSHHIWRERSKDKTPSPRQSRSKSKRLKQANKLSNIYVEIKKLYIASWRSHILHKRKEVVFAFEAQYQRQFRVDLRIEASLAIQNAINGKLLSGNGVQSLCSHNRIIFYFTKRIIGGDRNDSSVALHTHCSVCNNQCQGSVWFCCCCDTYICDECSDGVATKPGHERHPFAQLQLPPHLASFHSAYTCGCFDCGITVQVRAKCCTSVSHSTNSTHLISSVIRKTRSLSLTTHGPDTCASPPSPKLHTTTPRATSATPLSGIPPAPPYTSLAAVEYVSAGVDGLFRQKCRTPAGQQELLSRLRAHADFLLEAEADHSLVKYV